MNDNLLRVPLKGEPGVLRTEIDAAGHAVLIDFDPRTISEEGVRQVAERLASIGHQHYCRTILRLGGRASGAAEQKLEEKAQKINGIRRARATFLGGVMTVIFDDARLSEAQMIERIRDTGAPVRAYGIEAERKPETIRQLLVHWTTGGRLEVLFTILTLVFMVAGWASARIGAGWHNVFYFGAYLTGGYFGVRAGLQSLRQWTIDVDLLMVLAALGAAVVNAPFEGAMLLFLFSLSNVLQAYAIDRTRKAIRSLMKLRPERALARRDGGTVLLPLENLSLAMFSSCDPVRASRSTASLSRDQAPLISLR